LDGIVWAVNPQNDSLCSLLLYIAQLSEELFEASDVHGRFQIQENPPLWPLPPEMRHKIFHTAKEAFNNAVKYE
jgi:signal transduction histidine kinase